jgi:hypothetical protein
MYDVSLVVVKEDGTLSWSSWFTWKGCVLFEDIGVMSWSPFGCHCPFGGGLSFISEGLFTQTFGLSWRRRWPRRVWGGSVGNFIQHVVIGVVVVCVVIVLFVIIIIVVVITVVVCRKTFLIASWLPR